MDAHPVVVASGLTKRYGDVEAVKGIDFSVPSSSCVGLLGPNGAGKSTTMRMIMGLSTLTGGTMNVFGEPIQKLSRENKARIGRGCSEFRVTGIV